MVLYIINCERDVFIGIDIPYPGSAVVPGLKIEVLNCFFKYRLRFEDPHFILKIRIGKKQAAVKVIVYFLPLQPVIIKVDQYG